MKPYFGLRSYTDGGEHYPGQIGSEGTPGEWLDALLACTREWVRVLKPEGSLFVNLGDKYNSSGGPNAYVNLERRPGEKWSLRKEPRPALGSNLPPKSLLGLPWRYALNCMDQLGLILRAEIIWAKPNGLPESVTDRVRRAHEQVFHFTRQPRYYSAVDEIREPQTGSLTARSLPGFTTRDSNNGSSHRAMRRDPERFNALGKLPGSVWSIPSQPLQVPAHLGVDHFAAFPMELPRRVILGWSPPGVCTACGQGRRPIAELGRTAGFGNLGNGGKRDMLSDDGQRHMDGFFSRATERFNRTATITGYACGCPQPDAPTRPAVCLDPFGGTGTTALVASVLGRHGITADLSADYGRLARWRVNDPGERARAMQVPKPPPVPGGQEALFTL